MFNPQPPEIASQGDCEALLAEMRADEPGLVIELEKDPEGDYIAVWYGADLHVAVRDRDEWDMTKGDEWVMSRARAYGQQQLKMAG